MYQIRMVLTLFKNHLYLQMNYTGIIRFSLVQTEFYLNNAISFDI